MERGYPHPRRMYCGRGAGPWLTGADMPHENSWASRPFPQCSQGPPDSPWDHSNPPWDHPNPPWDHPNPEWDHPNPEWDHPNSPWDHPNPWCGGQDYQNSQCYPDSQWEQCHLEQLSRDYGYGFDNDNFLHRGSGSYTRCSRGKFYRKYSSSSHFYKGPKRSFLKGNNNPHNSSRVLVEVKQNKKGNDSAVKKDESAIAKERNQAQENSVASVKNTDPLQRSIKGKNSEVKKDKSAIPKKTKQAQEDSEVKKDESAIPKKTKQAQEASEVKKEESAIPKETKQAQEDSEVKKDESAIPKKTKQAQEDSEVKKDESAIPKKTKQAQEDSEVKKDESAIPKKTKQAQKASEVKKEESAIPKETKQAQEDSEVKKDKSAIPKETKQGQEDSEVKKEESAIPKETKQAQEDSEVKKDKSAIPKETKQGQEDSEVKKEESAIPKETKQAQEDSVALVKNTDPSQLSHKASNAIISPSQFSFHLPSDSLTHQTCSPAKTEEAEVSQKISKAIISPSQFSFRLPPDSLTCRMCKLGNTEDTLLVKLGTGPKTKDSCKVASCDQVPPSELTATLESLELKKEEEKIQLHKLNGNQATEVQPSQPFSPLSSKAPVEGQALSNATAGFNPVIKEEPVPASLGTFQATEALRGPSVSLPCAEAPTRKQAPSEIMKDFCPVIKEEQVPLESSQITDHFNHVVSPPALEIPFLSENTDECQSEGKEDLERTQMGSSHDACDAAVAGPSALPAVPTDVQSVPVLVRGKEETEWPNFWESESSLHAQNLNISYGGKVWAPEDCQEPSWGVDKAKKYDDVTEPGRLSVQSHSSLHSHYYCDQNHDTGSVLECCSSSPKSHHSSDSKHCSTHRVTKECLRSPLRQGHRSRSPLSRSQHPRSPLSRSRHPRSPLRRDRSHSWDSQESSRGRENNLWTCNCNKCHCKCCRNPSPERFQKRKLTHSYSAHKRHCNHPFKESSKPCRTSHSCSPENSMMTRKSIHHEKTKKVRSTSVKQTKPSKVKKKGGKVLAPVNHAAALAVKTFITSEVTEHLHPVNAEQSELVQLAASSEDTEFPHQSCARKETGISAPSKNAEDPRSVAILMRTNQIEQDYLQVMLNFAVVATMLLQKEPCMEGALEVALRANMRSIGDYYESMLKSFIDDYDSSKTS